MPSIQFLLQRSPMGRGKPTLHQKLEKSMRRGSIPHSIGARFGQLLERHTRRLALLLRFQNLSRRF